MEQPPDNTIDIDLAAEEDFETELLLADINKNKTTPKQDFDWGIVFQLDKSVWKNVLGFCIVNVASTLLIYYLKDHDIVDLTFKDKGHSLMSVLVSFLVVSRSTIVYNRYMLAGSLLGSLFRSSEDLVQHVLAYTYEDEEEDTRAWRNELVTQVLCLLSITMKFLSHRSEGQNIWDNKSIRDFSSRNVQIQSSRGKRLSVTEEEINSQAPVFQIYRLRKLIGDKRLKIDVARKMKLFSFIDQYGNSYHQLKKQITIPFPFPLVQMARTFLFFWVFTIPFALVKDMGSAITANAMTIFFLTYGYIGLESVSIEMDDPFGDDENDFDHEGMKRIAFDNIFQYVSELPIHGKEDACELQKRANDIVVRIEPSVPQSVNNYGTYSDNQDAVEHLSEMSELDAFFDAAEMSAKSASNV
uniref:Bestrophin homolog n=1 Tax=Leptocylindrus aporus TaxID=1398097 RepID=A0A7S0KAJ2_9STRA|eukprot:CAMPEP_0116054080 /NCGR_PEP_ID=MMETSP0322-20121206/2576_1 /TAXON_ID=163516 /ORGANISM="Leptocylindrus danicus var. apora, Strain B651" /LENGTH=412 /DNA_ID=CAMNT_0003537379 /DNA_START=35 /DNA_END=1273 /DNA_ORIENTATION=-